MNDFKKLKENYLSQKANSECSNRFPDGEKSMIVSHYHDRFPFFFWVDTISAAFQHRIIEWLRLEGTLKNI